MINSNISSLSAQRNLNTSQSALTTSLERLSSGLRINSAKDDAAGLAISERMTSQIRGLNQAARNANDGISLAQTAEGALDEIGNNLQRIRELAVQSSNATNSASDRAALQAEVTQLSAEITRVAGQTEFNGTSLLDGSFTNKSFQIGANANQTIDVPQIADARSAALGNNTLDTDGSKAGTTIAAATDLAAAASTAANVLLVETDLQLTNNQGTTGLISYAAGASAETVAGAINTAGNSLGIEAEASNTTTIGGLSVGGTVAFSLNGEAISAGVSDPADLTSLASAINGKANTTGVTASFQTDGDKTTLTLTNETGANIALENFVGGVTGDTATATFGGQTLTEGAADSAIANGTITLSSADGSIAAANANTDLFTATVSTFGAVADVDISTSDGSQSAIDVLDAALAQVNDSRADLGAVQNRFSSTVANLQNTSENLSAARSRIQDTDFASETASLTRGQILQQAGVAMLSQANSLPNNVLSLLR